MGGDISGGRGEETERPGKEQSDKQKGVSRIMSQKEVLSGHQKKRTSAEVCHAPMKRTLYW